VRSTRTGNDGRFAFEFVPAGAYLLSANVEEPPAHGPLYPPVYYRRAAQRLDASVLHLSAHGELANVDLVLPPALSEESLEQPVTLRFLDGYPAEYSKICLIDQRWPNHLDCSVQADADGRAILRLFRGETYEIYAAYQRLCGGPASVTATGQLPPLELQLKYDLPDCRSSTVEAWQARLKAIEKARAGTRDIISSILSVRPVVPRVATPQRVRVSQGISPKPPMIHLVDPIYPAKAAAANVEGTVLLKVFLNKAGRVVHVQRVKGHPLLARAAEKAVRRWQYQPYQVDGIPVEAESSVIVEFSLPQHKPSMAFVARGALPRRDPPYRLHPRLLEIYETWPKIVQRPHVMFLFPAVTGVQVTVTGKAELVLARLKNLGFKLDKHESPAGQLLGSIPKIQLVRASQLPGVQFIIPSDLWGQADGHYWTASTQSK
jgi:TonB family protein